jgi:transcription elongation factor GreA
VPEKTGTWLTQDAYDRLQDEYAQLTGPGRVAIANEIDERRQEGDLKENGGYHAAREEQAKQEARIARLREVLRDATVGEPPADDGIVEPGMLVVATVAGREMKFLVGSRESAEGTNFDVFSTQSPLGAAILGKKIGDETSYEAPNGKDIVVKVIAAEPFTG